MDSQMCSLYSSYTSTVSPVGAAVGVKARMAITPITHDTRRGQLPHFDRPSYVIVKRH
jgi:hypothetical protein